MVGTNKSLGQHWLKNRVILDTIADLAAGFYSDSSASKVAENASNSTTVASEVPTCLEIGPGLGTLTSSLLKRFNKVIAVEYDSRLAANLPKSFPGKNLEVIHADILDYDFTTISGDYAIAGNIPYYITSPILKKVLTTPHLAQRIALLMQKEVAERILSHKETVLSLFVKNHANVLPGPVVPCDEFTPPPQVDSQVLILEPHTPLVSEDVFQLIHQGFKSPRKKLIHNLTPIKPKDELLQIFAAISLSPDARPSDLSLSTWAALHTDLL